MKGMPLLFNNNRFTCLEVEQYMNNETSTNSESDMLDTTIEEARKRRKRRLVKWERKLPRSMTLAATPSACSLKLQVEIQTTDTQEVKSAKALLDCSASGLFAHRRYIEREHLNIRTLNEPIPVKNVDGTPNEAGPITEVLDVVLRYKGHSEKAVFAVTLIGDQDLILGLPWLKQHNPEDRGGKDEQMSRKVSNLQGGN